MPFKQLYIFIEGNDDEDFVKTVIKPLINKKNIKTWKYSKKKKEKIINFITSIKSMGADYIFITDFDERDCLENRIKEVLNEYSNLDNHCLAIVKNEIESWYISGINYDIEIDNECPKRLRKISIPDDTEKITKEDFIKMIPPSFKGSKIAFMQEILNCFDISIAKERNNSFNCFINDFIK